MYNPTTFMPNMYLISSELERAISQGSFDPTPDTKRTGIYLLRLKTFKSNNTIIYSYMYYDKLFLDSLVFYLCLRHIYPSLLKEELNKSIVFFDDTIKLSPAILGIELGKEFFSHYPSETRDLFRNKNYLELDKLYIYMLKLNSYISFVELSELALMDINSEYYKFLRQVLNLSQEFNINNVDHKLEDIKRFNDDVSSCYKPLDNSLVVCSDLQLLLSEFKKAGVTINQGPQSKRGEVSALQNSLVTIDTDYRSSLYFHHRHHCSSKIRSDLIHRSGFSFKNIHMNLGSVRWLSTTTNSNNSKRRQGLLSENFRGVEEILYCHILVSSCAFMKVESFFSFSFPPTK